MFNGIITIIMKIYYLAKFLGHCPIVIFLLNFSISIIDHHLDWSSIEEEEGAAPKDSSATAERS